MQMQTTGVTPRRLRVRLPQSARTTRAGSDSGRWTRSRRSHAPAVALGRAQRRRGVRHALPDGLRDGLRGVSDAQADDLRVRVLLQVLVAAARDLSHNTHIPSRVRSASGVKAFREGVRWNSWMVQCDCCPISRLALLSDACLCRCAPSVRCCARACQPVCFMRGSLRPLTSGNR